MKIRPFVPDDAEALVALWKSCNLLVSWNNPRQDIKRKLKVHPELFIVGELKGIIIASAMGGYEGHRGWINYLGVLPEYRRRGYARMLVEHLEDKLKAMGCPKINIQVRVYNEEAAGFYKGVGYAHEDLKNFGKRLIEDDSFTI